MDASSLRALIDQVAAGECAPDDAVRQLRRLPYADLGFARVDHHRDLRQGMPEAVYGPGKTPEQCAAIVGRAPGAGPTARCCSPGPTEAQVEGGRGRSGLARARARRRHRRAPTSPPWSSVRHRPGRARSSW